MVVIHASPDDKVMLDVDKVILDKVHLEYVVDTMVVVAVVVVVDTCWRVLVDMALEMMKVDTTEEQALAFLLVGKMRILEDHEEAMVVVLHSLVDKMVVDILLHYCWMDKASPFLHCNTVLVAIRDTCQLIQSFTPLFFYIHLAYAHC